MSDAQVIDIAAGAILIAGKLLGPLLAVTLAVGVGVAVVQTITQIQEATLTFVPKLIAAAAVLLLAGSWMLHSIVNWVQQLWQKIPTIG